MTDKTEAQPEALRVAAWLINAPFKTTHGDMLVGGRELRRLHADNEAKAARLAELEAQLSARQAAPDGWRLVPVLPTDAMLLTLASDGEAEVIAKHPEWHPMLLDRSGVPQRYAAMLSAAPPPPEREPLSKQQVSKIALDLLMTNCTWHALQNTGFFHEIVPFTVEIVAAAERAHGIGATNDNP